MQTVSYNSPAIMTILPLGVAVDMQDNILWRVETRSDAGNQGRNALPRKYNASVFGGGGAVSTGTSVISGYVNYPGSASGNLAVRLTTYSSVNAPPAPGIAEKF